MEKEKTIVMRAPVMFEESYVKAFITQAVELGHIPSADEFNYSEKDNSAAAENTTLMALSYTKALNTKQHNTLLSMVPDRISEIFKLFTQHGVVLSIYESYYSNPGFIERNG